jgi:hypothetical protein
MTTDIRDGSMGDVTSPTLPPLQARTYERVPADWAPIPLIGVHELILRSLVDRGIVKTRFHNHIRQWRRPPAGPIGAALVCFADGTSRILRPRSPRRG